MRTQNSFKTEKIKDHENSIKEKPKLYYVWVQTCSIKCYTERKKITKIMC